jgi:hypothetical protein
MKCFERLVNAHINSHTTPTDSQMTKSQWHSTLPFPILDKRNTYVRMLFSEYSSAFNTIVPTKLITKLRTQGLNTSLCNWIMDFLTDRHHVVRVGNDSQHRGPSGVCSESPPALPVHP